MPERVNPYIRTETVQVFKFSMTEEIRQLTQVQKINQKVVLSFYGNKIDMPFKLSNSTETIELIKTTAEIEGGEHRAIESYRVEITHPLGKTYFRCDIPKDLNPSTLNTQDAFAIAELNSTAKRQFEDYVISRKQYDLDFSAMDLSHRQARVARKYEWISRSIDLAMGTITSGVSLFTGGYTIGNFIKSSLDTANKMRDQLSANAMDAYRGAIMLGAPVSYAASLAVPKTTSPIFAKTPFKSKQTMAASALGAYKGLSSVGSSIAGLASISERTALQEEGFAREIREKALQSYRIDLGFERDKDDQLMTMRRLFAGESFNEVTGRQAHKALDETEKPAVDEVYLELWTTSGEQERYVKNFHSKFGVDCRVPEKEIAIKDDMRTGIYCIEDVEVYNLMDRIDFEYLKARLIGGIRFIKWEEFKGTKDVDPTDEKIQQLEAEIVLIKKEKDELEERDRETIHELQVQSSNYSSQLNIKTEAYTALAQDFRKKEEDLSTQTKLVGLYKDEANQLRGDLLKETHLLADEKKGHAVTKQQKTKVESDLQQARRKNQEYLSEIRRTIHLLRGTTPQGAIGKVRIGDRDVTTEEEIVREDNFRQDLEKAREYLRTELQKQKTSLEEQKRNAETQLQTKTQETQIQQQTIQEKDEEIRRLTAENARMKTQEYEDQICAKHIGWRDKNISDRNAQIGGLRAELGRKNQQIQTLTREKEELNNSLTAVREIEQQLRKQLEAPTLLLQSIENINLWTKRAFKDILQPTDFALVNCDNRLLICEFDRDTFAWYVRRKQGTEKLGPELKAYPDKKMIRITKEGETDYYWNNWKSNFSQKIANYKQYRDKMLQVDKRQKWVFQGNLTTRDMTTPEGGIERIPIFEAKPTSTNDRLSCEVHYSEESGWNKKGEGTRVTTYGEYLDVLGMEAVDKEGGGLKVQTKLSSRRESSSKIDLLRMHNGDV